MASPAAQDNTAARAIATHYEADGDFVSPTGDHSVGRGAFEAFYRTAFEAGYHGSAATAVHVQTLSASFALIEGYWSIQPTAGAKISQPQSGLFGALRHRLDSRWWSSAPREQSSAKVLRDVDVRSGED